jgi:WD40 repeat protein
MFRFTLFSASCWLALHWAAIAAPVYDRPVLVIEPGMHTAPVKDVAVSGKRPFFVTAAHDKTVRFWSTENGELLRTIRMPAGLGHVGELSSIAINPADGLVAVGGFGDFDGRTPDTGSLFMINGESGAIEKRLLNIPKTVVQSAFSPDGRYLAASLAEGGVLIFAQATDWGRQAADFEYGRGGVYGLAFAPDGRSLATASDDGMVRLYEIGQRFTPVFRYASGHQLSRIAFSPNGEVLAVGYDDAPRVLLLNAHTLEPLGQPDLEGLSNGSLNYVAWSPDGHTLYAGGRYQDEGRNRVILAWDEDGHGRRRALRAQCSNVDMAPTALTTLQDGRLLVVKGAPCFAMLQPRGEIEWQKAAPGGDFRAPPSPRGVYRNDTFRVSRDGMIVDFDFQQGGVPLRFDLAKLALVSQPSADGATEAPPLQPDVDVPLTYGDRLLVVAAGPSGRSVAGTDFELMALDANGALLWESVAAGPVWGAQITADGQIVVAAYGDGTIRWRRMADGHEIMALFVMNNLDVVKDQVEWVAWTPEGFFQATPGARGLVQWHVSRGAAAVATTKRLSDFPDFENPDALRISVREKEPTRAPSVEAVLKGRRQAKEGTGSTNCPGPHLHIAAIGIDDFKSVKDDSTLNYASSDAVALATELQRTQQGCTEGPSGSLYAAATLEFILLNKDATKESIYQNLDALTQRLDGSSGQDTVIVFYSGHGEVIGNEFFFATYGTKATNDASLKATALRARELQSELAQIKTKAKLLIFLDACHAGAAIQGTMELAVDNDLLKRSAVPPNTFIMTSSSKTETSWEDRSLGHGFFTAALLEVLNGKAPHDGNVIFSTELAHYVHGRVAQLTTGGNPQHPDFVMNGELPIFSIRP